MTFGFDSAVATVTDALDRLHTTATSHKRVMILEVMGRHAGWIALHGGIAGGAHVILIPEIPFRLRQDLEAMRRARNARQHLLVSRGRGRCMSGRWPAGHARDGNRRRPFWRNWGLSSRQKSPRAPARKRVARCSATCNAAVLPPPWIGFSARASESRPCSGAEGQFGSMVSYQNYQVRHVPIADAVNRLRLVPPDGEMVQTARDVEISFGD